MDLLSLYVILGLATAVIILWQWINAPEIFVKDDEELKDTEVVWKIIYASLMWPIFWYKAIFFSGSGDEE